MIITRTPLRISFVGGGADRPAVYMKTPGHVVSASINLYMTITVSEKFDGRTRLCYSRTEDVATVNELEHDLARESIKMLGIKRGLEVHSCSAVPAGTGLASSSAYTVGLLLALNHYMGESIDRPALAEQACDVEIGRCGKNIGKHDQYICALGGLRSTRFSKEHGVRSTWITGDWTDFERHLLLLYTGAPRQGDAGEVLTSQSPTPSQVTTLAGLADDFLQGLRSYDYKFCGRAMDLAWQVKRDILGVKGSLDPRYELARLAGAWGGKLCGAGGGGFMLFMAPPQKHRNIELATGMRAVPFSIDHGGAQLVYRDWL